MKADFVEGSLYVGEWDQNAYDKGLHMLQVTFQRNLLELDID